VEVKITPNYGNPVPIILFFGFVFAAVCAAIVLAPLGLVQRYRTGTRRRRARRWLAGMNVAALSLSLVLFICGALITARWVPDALIYSVGGLVAGCLLGFTGLQLTQWENAAGALYYTPNRFLILAITLVVAGRLAYGMWRLWHSWTVRGDVGGWLESAGISGSLGASATILGYSLTYWVGMLRKIQRTA
jgi:hypothetical protein